MFESDTSGSLAQEMEKGEVEEQKRPLAASAAAQLARTTLVASSSKKGAISYIEPSLLLVIFGWWSSSSLCQIQSKVAVMGPGALPTEALIFSQLMCGALLHLLRQYCWGATRPTSGNRILSSTLASLSERNNEPFLRLVHLLGAGIFGAAGLCCIIIATELIPTTLVHLIRGTEVVFVAFLGVVLKRRPWIQKRYQRFSSW